MLAYHYFRNNLFSRGRLQNLKCSQIKYNFRHFKRKSFTQEKFSVSPLIKNDTSNTTSRLTTAFKGLSFTCGFCGVVFIGSSIFKYENEKYYRNDSFLPWIKQKWEEMEGYNHKEGEFRKVINKYWNRLCDGEKIFWFICAANIFVYLCWKHPHLQKVMYLHFASNPFSKYVCGPMLLSVFSHYSFVHLFLNMYVLHSFSGTICQMLGKEQFIAFYLAGGVLSSYASHIIKLINFTKAPSLGASGAIMAMLGYFCTKYPDASLGIVFVPNFTFSADSALKGVMLFDLCGIIFRFKLFDHAAHLGGAIFGLVYATYGQLIWNRRYYVYDKWKYLKNQIKSIRDR